MRYWEGFSQIWWGNWHWEWWTGAGLQSEGRRWHCWCWAHVTATGGMGITPAGCCHWPPHCRQLAPLPLPPGTAAARRTPAATSSKPHITEGPSLLWTRVLPQWRRPPSPAKPRRRLLHRRRSPRPPSGSQGEGAPRTPNCSRCKPPERCCRRLPKAALFGARHRSSPISIHRRVTTGKVCFVSLAAIRFCHRAVIHCAPPFSCRAPHQNHVVCVSRVAACVASIHWVWIIWTGQRGSSRFELSINREPPLWTWFTLDRPSFLTYWSVLHNSGIYPSKEWCYYSSFLIQKIIIKDTINPFNYFK